MISVMIKTFLNAYKIPFLLSLTVGIILIALRVEKDVLNIILILLGSLLGMLILEIDYVLYAYFLEPEKEFSKTLQGYITHKDFKGSINYIYFHKTEVKDKTLNSALFQVVLGILMIFVMSSDTSLLIKSLIISTYVNSIYIMLYEYFEGRIKDWFWSLKGTPNKNTVVIFTTALLLILVFSLRLYS